MMEVLIKKTKYEKYIAKHKDRNENKTLDGIFSDKIKEYNNNIEMASSTRSRQELLLDLTEYILDTTDALDNYHHKKMNDIRVDNLADIFSETINNDKQNDNNYNIVSSKPIRVEIKCSCKQPEVVRDATCGYNICSRCGVILDTPFDEGRGLKTRQRYRRVNHLHSVLNSFIEKTMSDINPKIEDIINEGLIKLKLPANRLTINIIRDLLRHVKIKKDNRLYTRIFYKYSGKELPKITSEEYNSIEKIFRKVEKL